MILPMAKPSKREVSVLLVDGNLQRRNTLASRMRVSGIVVEAATGGFHALNLNENKTYNGVLVVEDSEDMPGREIIGLMRQQYPDKEKLPILYLGGKGQPEEILELMNLGANEFVVYNGNFQIVLEKLKHYLKMS